jgi:hypothetical protein
MEAMPAGLLVGIPLRHHESLEIQSDFKARHKRVNVDFSLSSLMCSRNVFAGPKLHILGNRLAPG